MEANAESSSARRPRLSHRNLGDRERMCLAEIDFRQSGCGTSDDDAVASGVFSLVKGFVGKLKQQINAICSLVKCGYTDRRGHRI